MNDQHEGRIAALRAELSESGVDGLVVSAPGNVFYLSGFRGSAGLLLIGAEQQTLFSDFRYRLQAQEQASDFAFVEVSGGLAAAVGAAAREAGLERLGYDGASVTCEQRDKLAVGAEGIALTDASGLVEKLRTVKSPEEVERIRGAAALADAALARMVSALRPGMTERQVALEGEFLMRYAGAERAAFDVIVASGPRSALPHAETTNRELRRGDLVVIDIGAVLDGYCSDMTRTFVVKRATQQAQDVYRLVYAAQRAGAAAVREGAVCQEVDGAARSLIEEAGYGEHFGHGLGHGVGIEVHEGPRLAKRVEKRLAAGNVVTVEPGVYLDGVGGVRLEDLLVVEADGAAVLTGSPMSPELPVL